MSQLGLDGRETPYPPPRFPSLTERQRDVLRFVRSRGVVRPVDVGVMMHAGRERPCMVRLDFRRGTVTCCRYASADGWSALMRLAARGLVYREARGRWRAVVAVEDWAGP